MSISKKQITDIEEVITTSLRNKFHNYNPEPASMPFHTRLLGKDRLALYSFIHSLNTNFGTVIFEPVAVALAKDKFKEAESHIRSGNKISEEALFEIQKIINNLETATTFPNKPEEIEIIRKVCRSGELRNVKPTRVDLFLKDKSGRLFLFDIKTAKPNVGGFREFKRTLLEWVASTLLSDPDIEVTTAIAIPYNPYEPQPYNRWTIRGMIDLDHELMVAEEFWDFLGGTGAYEILLGCFERVGIELRDEIDEYFSKFNV